LLIGAPKSNNDVKSTDIDKKNHYGIQSPGDIFSCEMDFASTNPTCRSTSPSSENQPADAQSVSAQDSLGLSILISPEDGNVSVSSMWRITDLNLVLW